MPVEGFYLKYMVFPVVLLDYFFVLHYICYSYESYF